MPIARDVIKLLGGHRMSGTIWRLLAIVYISRQWRRWARLNNIPTAPCLGANGFLGQLGTLLFKAKRIPTRSGTPRPDLMGIWLQASRETTQEGLFRATFGHWLLPVSRTIVICHGEKLVRQATSQKSWGLFRKGTSYHMARDLIGDKALLASPDTELWRRQRRIAQGAFKKSVLDTAIIPAVHDAVNGLCDRWKRAARADGRILIEFCDETPRLTIDVLGKVAFGVDFGQSRGGDEQKSDLAVAFHVVLTRMAKTSRNPLRRFASWMPGMEWTREYERALEVLNAAAHEIVDRRLASGDLGSDLVGSFLRASEGDDAPLDRQLVVDNLKTILFAGHDTTASALSWCAHLLTAHPEVQERLASELAQLGTGLPSAERLESLPYLDAVLRETLRLFPSAGFTKAPVEDLELGGFRLPKGVEVFFFPYLTHRDERLFSNAECFEPQRWLGEQAKSSSPESAGWMPFSLGARNCVGSRMALLELKAALHALLIRYEFVAPEEVKVPDVILFFTLEPNFVPIELRPRTPPP